MRMNNHSVIVLVFIFVLLIQAVFASVPITTTLDIRMKDSELEEIEVWDLEEVEYKA